MKVKENSKRISTLLLALILVASTVIMTKVQAAESVDVEQKCSIILETGTSYNELELLEIPVKMYRVGDITKGGNYISELKFEPLSLELLSSETTAADWEEKANLAKDIVEKDSSIVAAKEGVIGGGKGLGSGLQVGMYLVVASSVQSYNYTYSFRPFLISLPNNYYYQTGKDDWLYDVVAELKAEQEVRFGDVRINKTLSSYNATFDGAQFVFSVEALFEEEVVYSDVVTISFDGPGQNSALVQNIPAGANVLITEIYSGSCYELETQNNQRVDIIADQIVDVSFTNSYNQGLNGGTSIVNHFRYEAPEIETDQEEMRGSWDWEAQEDNNVVQQ